MTPHTNRKIVQKNEYYNTLNSTSSRSVYPERDVPPPVTQTFISRNEIHNTTNRTNEYLPAPVQPKPTTPTNQSYIYKREINETTNNNIYGTPKPIPVPNPPQVNSTVVYESRNTNTINRDVYPVNNDTYYPPNGTLPPSNQTLLYRKETTNTTNNVYGPPYGDYPHSPTDRSPPSHSTPYYGSPGSPGSPPTTNTYYSSQSSTTNVRNQHGPPQRYREPEPAMPGYFPVNGVPGPDAVDGQPPKELNTLLRSFDEVRLKQNEIKWFANYLWFVSQTDNYRGRKRIDDEPYHRRQEINTAVATSKTPPKPTVEQKTPTKNIAGPPVYYPPKPLFEKSEAQAAWRASVSSKRITFANKWNWLNWNRFMIAGTSRKWKRKIRIRIGKSIETIE